MSGHKNFDEMMNKQIKTNPKFAAAYEKAKRELDAKWEVECRYGNCVVFVSPDSSVGPDQDDGWGAVDCPCKANEEDYCP